MSKPLDPTAQLTPAEREAAQAMLAHTFDTKAAAAAQNKTLSTFYSHLAAIRKRTHCDNTIKAILLVTNTRLVSQDVSERSHG